MSVGNVVIRAEGLGKRYLIGHQAERDRYVALRDVVARTSKALVRSTRDILRGRQLVAGDEVEEFWALKDVSLEIKRGEVVGIIGRNGAGKSTLLKILSRITEPTTGRVEILGRVASLLEVGTGFHPELTGRENIYLNGAILGMSRAEIRSKFDEIVAFSGVETFIDTPVKRYSSGMEVRLAFAVAAHLQPEILIVDEVLAVGDAEFQKRCMGKMNEVAGAGRTVLLVSHNMAAVEMLCRSVIVMNAGRVTFGGSSGSAIRQYIAGHFNSNDTFKSSLHIRNRGDLLRVKEMEFLVNGNPSHFVRAGDHCEFVITYEQVGDSELSQGPSFSLLLHLNGQKVANLWTDYFPRSAAVKKSNKIRCVLPKWPFRAGVVRVDVYSHVGSSPQDWIEGSLQFESHDGPFYGDGPLTNPDQGIIFANHSWSN